MADLDHRTDLIEFRMPSLGADMDAGTIVEWRVQPGTEVRRGDIVAVVETDKSDLDVEAFHDGTVAELVVAPGVKVPVGTVLALLAPLVSGATAPSQPPAAPAPVAAAPVAPAPSAPAPVVATTPPAAPVSVGGPVSHLDSPVIRHLAETLHVDTAHLHGSGPGGRITRDDVERAARRRVTPRARRLARERGIDLAAAPAAPSGIVTGDAVLAMGEPATTTAPPTTAPPASPPPTTPPTASGDAMRRTIARLMVRSWQEIPHYQVATRIDVHDPLARLTTLNDTRSAGERVLPAALFVHAAARAAAAVPGVNGWWRDDAFVPGDGVHIAIVVALRSGGLLAPVVRDAAEKDLDTVMAELRDLVTRARTGRLRASEIGGATFTVTELGEGGVETVVPIIHPPQVAILGLGAVHDEPWADHGMLAVRPVLHATLAGDHRAIDGRIGSQYLTSFATTLATALEGPTP